MRILYICSDPGVPIFGRKGCSTHVRETCLALSAIGHEVRLVCPNLEGDDEERARITAVEVSGPTSRKLGFDLRRIILDRRIEKAAERLCKDWKPEAVYERYSLYGAAGINIAERHNLPHLLEANAFITREQEDRIRWLALARWQERRVFKRARHVVVVSDPLVQEIGDLRGGTSSISKMPMAVNLDLFNPDVDGSVTRRELGLEGKFVLGYVGTLTSWHGIDLLFELARRIRDLAGDGFAILVVGGDERRIESNRAKVREAGLEGLLRFHGAVPYLDVPRHLRAMDAALVPDTTYWSSPAKLFEYQGAGLPVLAPRYPAIEAAMQDGEEGLIFEPRNVAQLAGKVVLLMKDPALGKRMGAMGRERAVRFHSWEAQGEAIVDIFRRQARELGPPR